MRDEGEGVIVAFFQTKADAQKCCGNLNGMQAEMEKQPKVGPSEAKRIINELRNLKTGKRYVVHTDSMLQKVEATFSSKADLLAYAHEHGTRADAVALYDKQNPNGFVFMGWDEIGE